MNELREISCVGVSETLGQRGLGQGPITAQVPAVAVVSSWAIPLAIGIISAAAGFALAYAISQKT